MNRILLVFLAFSSLVGAEGENGALLGIVVVDVDGKAVIADVLPGSPAKKAGIEPGDRLLMLGTKRVATSFDVGPALSSSFAGETVEIAYMRGKKEATAKARLMHRDRYSNDYLKRRRRGEIDFKALPWHVFAWANTRTGKEPTYASTRGKVVVIHTFQSW